MVMFLVKHACNSGFIVSSASIFLMRTAIRLAMHLRTIALESAFGVEAFEIFLRFTSGMKQKVLLLTIFLRSLIAVSSICVISLITPILVVARYTFLLNSSGCEMS